MCRLFEGKSIVQILRFFVHAGVLIKRGAFNGWTMNSVRIYKHYFQFYQEAFIHKIILKLANLNNFL